MNVAALWVGDSFTAGEGADVLPALTYPWLVGERFGWRSHVDAQNGTGFVNDGYLAGPGLAPLIDRLPRTVRLFAADVVLVDAGRNDVEVSPLRLREAVTGYLTSVRGAYPGARIVLILPSLLDRVQPPEYIRIGRVLAEVAPSIGAIVIDPAHDDRFTGPTAWGDLVCVDGFHPSAAGQAHYAEVIAGLLADAGVA